MNRTPPTVPRHAWKTPVHQTQEAFNRSQLIYLQKLAVLGISKSMFIFIDHRRSTQRIAVKRIRAMAEVALTTLGFCDAELNVIFCDDAVIAKLNSQWRGKQGATDVLSFGQYEKDLPHTGCGVIHLGDVVISTQTAKKQAGTFKHSLEHELCILLVHGILHLLGHDHVHGGHQARKMQSEEKRVLKVIDKSLKK